MTLLQSRLFFFKANKLTCPANTCIIQKVGASSKTNSLQNNKQREPRVVR